MIKMISHIRGWLVIIFLDLLIGLLFYGEKLFSFFHICLASDFPFVAQLSSYSLWNAFSLFFVLQNGMFFIINFMLFLDFIQKKPQFPKKMIWFIVLQFAVVFIKHDNIDFPLFEQLSYLSPDEMAMVKNNLISSIAINAIICVMLAVLLVITFIHDRKHCSLWFLFFLLTALTFSLLSNSLIDIISMQYVEFKAHWATFHNKKRFFTILLTSVFSVPFWLTKSAIWIPYFLVSKRVEKTFSSSFL